MTKTPLLLLWLAFCAPALGAPSDDVLLDDFGQPIHSETDAVLPPAPAKKPKVEVPPAPVKPKQATVKTEPKPIVKAEPKKAEVKPVVKAEPKKAEVKLAKSDCSAEKNQLAACAEDYLHKIGAAKNADRLSLQRAVVSKGCPTAMANFLGCAGFDQKGASQGTAAVQGAIAHYQQNVPAAVVEKKPEPKPAKPEVKLARKSEDRVPQEVPAEPKVIAPPKSMQQKFPETIWVFSGPDQEEEARLAKKAERPTILPPKVEKTPDGSQPVKVVVAPEPPKPVAKTEDEPKKEPEVKTAEAAKPTSGPKLVKVEVVKGDPAKSGLNNGFVPVSPAPKDESRFPLTTPEKVTKAEAGKDGKGELPAVEVPPASGGNAQFEPEADDEIAQSTDPEEDQASVAGGDKKDAVRVARVPPGAAAKIVPPAAQPVPPEAKPEDAEKQAEATPQDIAPLTEAAPVDLDSYLTANRTPKFIRVNVQGYNVRKTPEFEAGRKDNIDFQTVGGSLFAVTRVIPGEEGLATGIFVDGEERWVFMPWSRRADFQFCESEACFSDVAMGLDAIASAGRIDPNDLLACDIIERQSPALPPEVRPLPKRITESEYQPTPRSKEELSALDKRVNRAPSVKVEYGQSGCVVDTRNRPKPNFRNFRSLAEAHRAFIDYMTPFALEVQEATGLPAAVVIGQAALESGWGTSGLFNHTRNIFGHSCWRYGSSKTLEIDVLGKTKSVTGVCNTPRPAYAGGYYMTFREPQDSVYAYAANLLSREHNYYPQVRAAVKIARPRPADWRQVVDGLKNYDGPNPAYRSLVRDIIVKNGLDKLENKKLCR